MKRYIILLLVAYLSSNCEKTIPLDLDQHESQYVIEGLVTNQQVRHTIRISKTVAFNETVAAEKVSNALVNIQDDQGRLFEFEEEAKGVYQAKEAFAGEVGRNYTLTISIDGQHFIASETLPSIVTIDSIVYAINQSEKDKPAVEGEYYEVLLFTDEPQETVDSYLAKFYRNGVIDNDEGESVFYFNDQFLSDRINGLPAPYFYSQQDTFRFEMYSLSKKAYRFFFELEANINSDGGVFSGTPANILTNLEGGAIGYFQVSGLVTAEIVIE